MPHCRPHHYAHCVQQSRPGPCRLCIVVSHPIQHFSPQYRSLAALPCIALRVHFDSLRGAEAYYDPDFMQTMSWGRELLEGFEWSSGASKPVKEALSEFAPDWLIVYGYRGVSLKALWWGILRRGTKVAYISDSEHRHTEASRRRALRRVVLRLLFARIDAFLTVGNANEEFYTAAGVPQRKQIRMNFPIERGWAIDGTVTPSTGSAVRQALGIPDEHQIILTVGKLIERKRPMDIVECARRLSDQPVSFLLVGEGPERRALEAAASELPNVHVVGFVPPSELPTYYDLASIYLHPSAYDPHPLAISEAAAFGCAFVVSDAVGSWGEKDDVRPHDNGFVYATGNIDQLTSHISALAADPVSMKRMSSSSITYSREAQLRAHGGFVADLLELGA